MQTLMILAVNLLDKMHQSDIIVTCQKLKF